MTKRMERPRVLYSAKTKTTKVVLTSSTRRPLSLPTSFQTDDLPAPLASVESDVSLITKREREFPKSTHISGPIHKPSSLTESRDGKIISSNKDVTVWKRDNSNTDLVRSTPYRSTIKLRNSKTCDLPKSHPSYRGYQKSHRPRSEGVTEILSSDTSSSQRGIRSDSDLSTINNNTQHRLQNELSRKVRHTSSIALDRNTEGSRKQLDCGTTIKVSTGSYPEKKDVRNTAPPVASKPKICSKVAATNIASTRNKLPSTSLLESSPIIIRREGHDSSKENHVMPTPCPRDSDKISKPCDKKVQTYQQLERLYPQSNNKTTPSLTNHSVEPYSSSKFPAKGLLPEMNSPFTYSQNENGEPPEMYTEMSATTTSGNKVASHFTGQHRDQIAQSKCNQRKPLAAISISSNTPTSSIEDIHVYSEFNITNTEIARSRYQHNDQNILKNTSSIDKDPTNIIHKEHEFSDQFGNFIAGDFKPRWKRNSMRLATQGYSSMSDLTESVECLNGCEEDVAISTKSSKFDAPIEKLDGKPAETCSQNSHGKMSENYQPKSERREYQNISNDASLNMKEIKESSIDCDIINTSIHDEDPVVTLARNGMTRLSYRMATLGVTNAWTQEGDWREYVHNNDLSPVIERPDGDLRSDNCNPGTQLSTGSESHLRMSGVAPNTQPFSSAAPGLDGDRLINSQASEANCAVQHVRQSDTEEQNEHLNKIKRWSYLLATTASISDLTFLDGGLDLVDSSLPNNNKNGEREVSHCATAYTQRNKHIKQFQHLQTKGSTYYNNIRPVPSKRNSSEINNESYTSAHKTVIPESTNGSYLTKQMKETTTKHGQRVLQDSSDVDSTDSGNTSCYYSASPDTSFVTADGDPLNSGHSQASSQWSPGQTSLHQKPRSASQLHGDQLSPRFVSQTHASHRLPPKDQNRSPVQPLEDRRSFNFERSYNRPLPDQHPPSQNETSQSLSPHDPKVISANNKECQQQPCHIKNNNTISKQGDYISQDRKGPKHSSPVDNVLKCYGCGLNDKQSTQAQPYVIANNTRGTLGAPRNRDSNSTNHRRHPEDLRKISSERNRFLYPVGLSGNMPVRVRKCPVGSDIFLKDQSSTSGIPSTPSFSSIASFADDMRWEATPRFPPSLGRPRRKLYAGFDSQPLPMDSYTSDSSSVFSIQSCGSWGASRSAEVESSSKFQDVAPSIRSVSSIAYGSTRSLSDKDDEYFLTDSKHINFYNLYPHFSNSAIEDCLKDSFYGKNFSRESLESFLSDATTIGENPDYKSDITKLNTDYVLPNDVQHKNATIVRSEQINEKSPRDNFNSGSVTGSAGCKLNGGNFEGNKRLQEISKASSCTTASIPRSIRKGKYLSSKDILDLILTPDKPSKKETATLERQAQKMYEVILCCNEVEFQPAKEYHF